MIANHIRTKLGNFLTFRSFVDWFVLRLFTNRYIWFLCYQVSLVRIPENEGKSVIVFLWLPIKLKCRKKKKISARAWVFITTKLFIGRADFEDTLALLGVFYKWFIKMPTLSVSLWFSMRKTFHAVWWISFVFCIWIECSMDEISCAFCCFCFFSSSSLLLLTNALQFRHFICLPSFWLLPFWIAF